MLNVVVHGCHQGACLELCHMKAGKHRSVSISGIACSCYIYARFTPLLPVINARTTCTVRHQRIDAVALSYAS